MAKKRKRISAERHAWDERSHRIRQRLARPSETGDRRLRRLLESSTFEERTDAIRGRIAELNAQIAAKKTTGAGS
jgi:hypothetical protein